ncbi:type II secretion system F family protein [Nocardioides sp. MAH-18]|uniref:Type II secretion system F family protein n=1 Tax=Nocardioides agri TaxID=2682843 RepID=A0A6L6XYT5_9ACTN|nr:MULTISPECIES: type II secretion system F family protein [unclassified Nocardioides]MBA2952731.1 type II secretion system F family protein [Nocardioides sp. CGMCC 1.13656]MVQ51893.1 type II secretion system F family protein [Nocardioides sp. MAH-18]
MPKFAYVGVNLDGIEVKGTHKAASRSDAEVSLYERHVRQLRVTEKKSLLNYEISGPRIKREEVMHLSRQIAAFLRAGLPILEAVHTIGAENDNSSVRRMMNEIEDGLRSGERFSDCLDRFPKVFPQFYRSIVRSAELTGELDTVLARLSGYIERDLAARRKLKSAIIYPVIVAAMSSVTVLVLAIYVLPKFEDFFASLDAELPLPTRMLLGITGFLGSWWWAIAGAVVASAVLFFAITRTNGGKYARDAFLLKVPVLGETIQYALVERFCRVLGSMVSAGVNLTDALAVTTEALRNRVYIKRLGEVTEQILEGQGIAGPLARTGIFPGTATQMLRVGEDTGSLDTQLEVTAGYYETELDYKIAKLTALFEPIVIVVMGLIVGFVAVALVSAMYGIFRQVNV